MKFNFVLTIALFAISLPATAQTSAHSQNIAAMGGHPLDNNASAEVWKSLPRTEDVTVSLSQAPGVVEVQGSSNNGSFLAYFAFNVNTAVTVAARMVAPNGDTVNYPVYQFEGCSGCGSNAALILELWNGRFPWSWQTGVTTFQVFVMAGGKISIATGTVSIATNDAPPFAITGISQSTTNGQVVFLILGIGPGNKTSQFYGMIGDSVVLSESSFKNANGVLSVTIPAGTYVPAGTTPLTICRDGACRTVSVDSAPALSQGTGPKG